MTHSTTHDTHDTPATLPTSQTWQQRKSGITQRRILQATIDTIFEVGYNLTTTDKVAIKAGVSRGAMLHHFPVRKDLIHAAVKFLNEQRLAEFLTEENAIQGGSNRSRIGAGIDVYWGQISSPLSIVFQELKVLSRTDAELRAVLRENAADFERAWTATVERVFPDLILSAQHKIANLITRNLCEGMMLNTSMTDDAGLNEQILAELKNYLRHSYRDVRDTPSQRSAQTNIGAPMEPTRKNRHQ